VGKKIFYLLILFCLCHIATYAKCEVKSITKFPVLQYAIYEYNYRHVDKSVDNFNDSIISKNKVSFGVKSGINWSKMNFNKGYPLNDYPYKQNWKPGLTMGTFMHIPLNDKWTIHQEYNFTKIRGDYIPLEAAIHLNYISIPILIRYSLMRNLHILTGLQFDLLFTGKQIINEVTEDITKSTEERNVGLNLGVQYFISKNFFVEGRFMHGLNDIGLWQRIGNVEYKHEMIVLSIGYLISSNY